MKIKKIKNLLINSIIVVMLLFLYSVTYLGETLNVFSNKSNEVYYNGNRQNNNVSLMVNVYWGTEYLDDMLKIFKENNIKTTFFVGGCWVAKNAEYLLKIYNDGHEIANHGYFHKDHKNLSREQNQQEIFKTHQLVEKYTGISMELFAPPSGSFSSTTLEVANQMGYKTIMWSKDTIDWRDKNTSLIYQRATTNIKNGDLILMHPTQNTVEALSDIINFYQKNNYNLTTVSKNIL